MDSARDTGKALRADPDAERRAGRAGALYTYPAEIEADFRHHYHGLDVRDLWRPGGGRSRMTWRMFGSLLEHLPPESAYRTGVANSVGAASLAAIALQQTDDGKFGAWSHTDHLLALIADRLLVVEAGLYRSRGWRNVTTPQRIPRPGIPPAITGGVTGKQRAEMERHRAQIKQAQRLARAKAKAEGGASCQTPTRPGQFPLK